MAVRQSRRQQPAAREWPSQRLEPRTHDSGGVVRGHAGGPASAIMELAMGHEQCGERDVAAGLLIALSVVTCRSVDDLSRELSQRLS